MIQRHVCYPYGMGKRDNKSALDTVKRPAFPWKQHRVALGAKEGGDMVSKTETVSDINRTRLRYNKERKRLFLYLDNGSWAFRWIPQRETKQGDAGGTNTIRL